MAATSLDLKNVRDQISIIFNSDMHLKRQHSLADAAFGLLNSESLRLHTLGEGLALAKGLNKKHATKQIDRLLGPILRFVSQGATLKILRLETYQ